LESAPAEWIRSPQVQAPATRLAAAAHLPALTGLRFVLALWVILHHLTGPGGMLDAWCSSLPHALDAIVRRGYLAVSTFFVLSGFVLARSYAAGAWNRRRLLRYGVARLARIYPVYVFSLLVVAPFIVEQAVPGKPALLARYGLLLLGWTGTPAAHWNTPAWSLSCEMFFYICFPAALALTGRPGWRRLGAWMALACVLPAALAAAGVPDMWKPLVHFGDFLMGILASRAYDLMRERGASRGWRWYAPASLLAAVLIAWPGLLGGVMEMNTPLRLLNAGVLVGLGLGGGRLAQLLSLRPVVYLGKASYAMYILHVPLLWWYGRWRGGLQPVAAGALYIAGVVAISALVYGVVEEPANRALRRVAG